MDTEYMLSQIELFLRQYNGTAIGRHYFNWLDNARGNAEDIETIYNELADQGYVN